MKTKEVPAAFAVAFDPRIGDPLREKYVALLIEEAATRPSRPLTFRDKKGHAR